MDRVVRGLTSQVMDTIVLITNSGIPLQTCVGVSRVA